MTEPLHASLERHAPSLVDGVAVRAVEWLRARVTPASIVSATSLGVVLFHTAFLVRYTLESGHYVGDDVVTFHDARTLSFLEHVAKPIDVHAVPLYRAVGYAVAWLAPMKFSVGVALLTSLHLLTLLALYRAVRRLAPSPFVPVLVAAYASHVYLGSLFVWWTAGLVRIPYLCLSAVALWGFAGFREAPTWRRALVVLVPYAASLGFFEKALLFPGVLLSVELCLYRRTPALVRSRSLGLILGAFTISAGQYVLSRFLVEKEWQALMRDVPFLVEHTRLSWLMLLRSAIGYGYEGTGIALCVSGGILAVTVALSRWNAVVWVLGGLVVSLQLLVTGLSEPRSRLWGHVLALFSHRYYTEVLFVLVIFVALALREAIDPSGTPPPRANESGRGFAATLTCGSGRAWLLAVVACAAAVTLSLGSAREWAHLSSTLYTYAPAVKKYRDQVEGAIAALEQAGIPLVLEDGLVPRLVDPLGGFTARHSFMLIAMGKNARFARPGPGVYRITDSGAIVPTWRRTRP